MTALPLGLARGGSTHGPSPKTPLTDFSFEWDEQPVELTLAQTAEPQTSDFVEAAGPGVEVGKRPRPPSSSPFPKLPTSHRPRHLDAPPSTTIPTRSTLSAGSSTSTTTRSSSSPTRSPNWHRTSGCWSSRTANPRRSSNRGHRRRRDRVGDADVECRTDRRHRATHGAVRRQPRRYAGTHGRRRRRGRPSAGTSGDLTRMTVELERLRSEVQALKRRLPVRARELDAADIAEKVTASVLAALAAQGIGGRSWTPSRSRRHRRARPRRLPRPSEAGARAGQGRPPSPSRRPTAESPDAEPPDSADYPVATAKRATRQRPLRAD